MRLLNLTGTKGGRVRSKSKKGEPKPSADELRQAICDILKEVDFNTVSNTMLSESIH